MQQYATLKYNSVLMELRVEKPNDYMLGSFFVVAKSAAAVNRTSVEEFRAVSVESWITPTT